MRFSNLEEVLKTLHPDQSVQCMHPDQLVLAARTFVDHFPGHALYAVKSNPSPYVLQHLYAAGIRHFDVASLSEIKLVRGLFPMAHLAFMHPIKSREAIRTAYFEYGVRDFVIDTFEEMHKILQETKVATDLGIIVRINMPKGSAACPLVGKFGCTPEVAVSLLQDARKVSSRVGISFHVGSQSTDPESYAIAIRKAGEVMRQADIELDVLDVGGGFPIPYLGTKAPALTTYFDVIRDEIVALNLPESCEIWAEPGRALSGLGSTLLVKVELRKPAVEGQTGGDALYINDGSYGNMFEVACMKWSNTVHLVRPARRGRKAASKTLAPFRFFGPTCDSVDYMPGPFMLPEDVCEGDWIAIQGMGAYTAASQSNFNGFCSDLQVEIVSDSTTSSTKRRSRSSSNLTLVKA
jgi:ornithine decarboxylase